MPSIASVVPNFTNQTIDDGRLRLLHVLGEGAYGVVYLAVDEHASGSSSNPNLKQYAVKVLAKADPASRYWAHQQREMAAHSRVSNHPNIVTLHDVLEDDWFIFMILDYCPGGDLFEPLIERHVYARNDALVKKVFLQILDAVQYCHDRDIFHRDLKPDNILTNEDGTEIYLGDFGLATSSQYSESFGCGSSYYLSPECIGEEYDYQPYSTRASDVWALGVILTNLIAGRNPWNLANTSNQSFLKYLAYRGYLRETLPISKEANAILESIFTMDPGARIRLPALREKILAAETFFMSEEDIARSSTWVQLAAAEYRPHKDKHVARAGPSSWDELGDSEAEDELPAIVCIKATNRSESISGKSVDTQSSTGLTTASNSDSGSESQGPVTPATIANDPAFPTKDIPDLQDEGCIGLPAAVVAKSRAFHPTEGVVVIV